MTVKMLLKMAVARSDVILLNCLCHHPIFTETVLTLWAIGSTIIMIFCTWLAAISLQFRYVQKHRLSVYCLITVSHWPHSATKSFGALLDPWAKHRCSVGAGLVLVVLVHLVGISARNVLQNLVLGGLSGCVLQIYSNIAPVYFW